jgi:hypothetical protein
VQDIFLDKEAPVRVFIADYDLEGGRDVGNNAAFGKDHTGVYRFLEEGGVVVDTAAVRNIINKRGNPVSQAKRKS